MGGEMKYMEYVLARGGRRASVGSNEVYRTER
jgi:hypothetical protein